MSEKRTITLNSIEDAWKLAKEDGYEGTLEAFDTLCKELAEKAKSEKIDVESMESIAGGKSIGDWCKDNTELLIGVAGAIGTAAVTLGTYWYCRKPSSSSSADTSKSVPDSSSVYSYIDDSVSLTISIDSIGGYNF